MKHSFFASALVIGSLLGVSVYFFLQGNHGAPVDSNEKNKPETTERSQEVLSPEHRNSEADPMLSGTRVNKTVDFKSFGIALSVARGMNERRSIVASWIPLLVDRVGGASAFERINATMEGELANYAMSCVVRAVSQKNDFPQAALLVTRMPSSKDRISAVSGVASKIIAKDLASARNWYAELFDNERGPAISGFRAALAVKRDIGGLQALLEFDCPLTEKKATIRSIVSLFSQEQNEHGYRSFIASIPTEYKAYAEEMNFGNKKFANFADSISGILDIQEKDSRENITASRVSAFARVSPTETAKQIENLPESLRLVAVKSLSREWVQINPNALSEWIGGLPQGSLKDSAIRIFCEGVRRTDPAAALESAKAINNTLLREELLKALSH